MPVLCGVNTGHHILLDTGPGDSLELEVVTDLASSLARDWSIRLTQLSCNPGLAGCFQHLTGRTGQKTSMFVPHRVSDACFQGQ